MENNLRSYLWRVELVVSLGFALGAYAISNPPYDVYPYLADGTDNPPINYMKVCEPGRSGEDKASYVVLGISFPRTYQAVNADFDGDLVVPAYIDGLPVRKINEAAFVACTGLRSIKIVDDKPIISVTPELSEAEKSIRKYTIYGKMSLSDSDWKEVNTNKESEYNFFKVTVEMK